MHSVAQCQLMRLLQGWITVCIWPCSKQVMMTLMHLFIALLQFFKCSHFLWLHVQCTQVLTIAIFMAAKS
jgi:hypothetical protein